MTNDHTALPAILAAGISQNVEQVWTALLEPNGVARDAWEDGIHTLHSIIEQGRPDLTPESTEQLTDLIGSYLGQAIIAVHGGQWADTANGPIIALTPEGGPLVFDVATRAIQSAEAPTIYQVFHSVPAMVAQAGGNNVH